MWSIPKVTPLLELSPAESPVLWHSGRNDLRVCVLSQMLPLARVATDFYIIQKERWKSTGKTFEIFLSSGGRLLKGKVWCGGRTDLRFCRLSQMSRLPTVRISYDEFLRMIFLNSDGRVFVSFLWFRFWWSSFRNVIVVPQNLPSHFLNIFSSQDLWRPRYS